MHTDLPRWERALSALLLRLAAAHARTDTARLARQAPETAPPSRLAVAEPARAVSGSVDAARAA